MYSLAFICISYLFNSSISPGLMSINQVEWSLHYPAIKSSFQIYVAPCDSPMSVAIDSHFTKDFSNPDQNIAVFGTN